MASNGHFGITKSGIVTFFIGLSLGFIFTYFVLSSPHQPTPVLSIQSLANQIPLSPHDHDDLGNIETKPPTKELTWKDELSHSHKGFYFLAQDIKKCITNTIIFHRLEDA